MTHISSSRGSRLMSLVIKHDESKYPGYDVMKTTFNVCDPLIQNPQPQSSMRKTSAKVSEWGNLQYT